MEATTKPTTLLAMLLLLTVPLSGASSHDDPNIVDDVGEGDPMTGGATPLPPSLDIVQANISPAATSVDFTIQVQSLLVPHTLRPFSGFAGDEVHYELRFGLGEEHQDQLKDTVCEGATDFRIYTRTSYGAYLTGPVGTGSPDLDPDTMKAMARCVDGDGYPNFWLSYGGGVEAWADRGQSTVTIRMDRVIDDEGVPFLQPDTNLTEPEAMVYTDSDAGLLHLVYDPVYEPEQTPPPFEYYDYAGPGTNQTV